MTKFATEGTGWLKVQITTGQDAVPLGNVNIKVLPSGGTEPIYEGVTDETGVLEGMPLACPPRALSLEPDPSQLPYGVYDLTAALEGYSTLRMYNFEVLDGEVTFAQQNMEPINETTTGSPVQPQEDIVDTPPHGPVSYTHLARVRSGSDLPARFCREIIFTRKLDCCHR